MDEPAVVAEAPSPVEGAQPGEDQAVERSDSELLRMEWGMPPPPEQVPRPPAGTRVFVTEPPEFLLCSICHDAFKLVRAARRAPRARKNWARVRPAA